MKNLVLLLAFGISVGILSSCSSRRNSSSSDDTKRKGIIGLKPTTGRPSTAVINASGDGLTPGVNSHNRTTGSSKENAVAIANEAISKANSLTNNMTRMLDTLSGKEFLRRFAASNKRQMKITATAQKEGESQKIKEYASMIMKDHQQLQRDLDKLTGSFAFEKLDLVVTRSKALNSDAQHRNSSEYIQMTIEDHQNMIRLLEAARVSDDASLSTLANKYLPILKKHLSAAQDLTKK